MGILSDKSDRDSREARIQQLIQEKRVQLGIAYPLPRDQEHLLIIRLDITGVMDRSCVRKGLKRLCGLFERIYNGEKLIDELDKSGRIVRSNLVERFNFSATIGFGKGFFEELKIPSDKSPRKLRKMPDHEGLGDVSPYSLVQTDLIIQLGSSKDFVNRWVLENTIQPDEDEEIEMLMKKRKDETLNETGKRRLEQLLKDITPDRQRLEKDTRFCPDGQIISSDEEECTPDIMSAIGGWATITDIHSGFQRIDGRNLMGFNDGVSNPRPGDKKIFDEVVWTTSYDECAELEYGTYMVFQKIEHDLDQWRQLSLDEQEEWIGRSKGTGLLLGTLDDGEDRRLSLNLKSSDPQVRKKAENDLKELLDTQSDPNTPFYNEDAPDIKIGNYVIRSKNMRQRVQAWSHVRKANPRLENGLPKIVIFRRGYPYVETGSNNRIRSGLLFVCFQRDIEKGFEVIKKRFLNNKNFPVPEKRKFTEDELKERRKHGRFNTKELQSLPYAELKRLGLDDKDLFKDALKEAGDIDPDININPRKPNALTLTDLDPSLVTDTQNTGREGLAGPSEHGVIPSGEFVAIVPSGGGYYFIPPIPNKRIRDIGQQFFE